jgi:FtsP/CotA-like multicopper oxidase with cupredoxin domain
LDGRKNNNTNKDSRRSRSDSSNDRGFTFNGKVVFGIGIIMIAAVISTILAMMSSQSPQIHLSTTKIFGGQGQSLATAAAPVASTQVPPANNANTNTNQHIDKRFVLVQHDFGWNGTFGGPPIRVSKGDVVQITIINAGMMAHNFGIAAFSQQSLALLQKSMNMPLPDRVRYLPYNVMAAKPCPGCKPVFQGGEIDQFMQPDSQQVVTFTASQAGQFKYFCQVRGHLWLGMIGDFIVVNPTNLSTQQTTAASSGGAT